MAASLQLLFLAAAALLPVQAARKTEWLDQLTGPLANSPAHGLVAVVTSMQQTAQRTEAGFTPGLASAVDALLAQLAFMKSSIKAHHASTQDELDKMFGELERAANLSVELKHSADLADEAWVNCVPEEKAALEAVEAAKAMLSMSVPIMTEKCDVMVNASEFSVALLNTSLTCDQRVHSCRDLYVKWEKGIGLRSEAIERVVSHGVLTYKVAKRHCDNATELVANETKVLRHAEGNWRAKRMECRVLDGERQKDMCAYGMRLQEKCAAEAEYEELLSQIVETNTTYSELDLEAEWDVVQTVTCMLLALKDDGKVVGIQECQSDAESFEDGVGTLTKRAADLHRLAHLDEAWCSRRPKFVSGPLGFILKSIRLLLGYGDSASAVELKQGHLGGGDMVEHVTDAKIFRKEGSASDSRAGWLACVVEQARLKVSELQVTASRGKIHVKTVNAFDQSDESATCSPAEVNAKLAAGALTEHFSADNFVAWGFGVVGLRYSMEGAASAEGFLPRSYKGSEGRLLGNGSDARQVELVRGNVTERRTSGLSSLPASLYRRTAGFRASAEAERWLAVHYDHEAGYSQLKMVQLEVSVDEGQIYLTVISAHRTSIKFKESYLSEHGTRVTAERANKLMDAGALEEVNLIQAADSDYGLALEGLAFSMQQGGEEEALEGFAPRGCSVGSGRLLGPGVDPKSAELKEVHLGGKEIGEAQVATALFRRTGQHLEFAARWLACVVDLEYGSLKIVEVEVRVVDGSLYAIVVAAKVKAHWVEGGQALTQQSVNEAMDHEEAMNVNIATYQGNAGFGVVAIHVLLKMREYRHKITFSDQTWTFPRGNNSDNITSAEFLHFEPWAEAFNSTANAPFEFCKAK